jgi:hypothetical protein
MDSEYLAKYIFIPERVGAEKKHIFPHRNLFLILENLYGF